MQYDGHHKRYSQSTNNPQSVGVCVLIKEAVKCAAGTNVLDTYHHGSLILSAC